MTKTELEKRTKSSAVAILRFVGDSPCNGIADVVGRQLMRAGTSIGANYREANRAESRKDFIHKIGIVEKEASEAQYWLELIDEIGLGSQERRQALSRECQELLAIFTRIGRTTKEKAKFGGRNSKVA